MSSSAQPPRNPKWPPNFVRRGNVFYVQVRVPESLRGVVTAGRATHIRRSLRTSHEAEAIRRHRHVEAEIKSLIETARREPDGSRKGKDTPGPDEAADAAFWREHLMSRGVRPSAAMADELFSIKVEDMLGWPVGTRFDEGGREREVYAPGREERTGRFVDLVKGTVVPVGTDLDRFFADRRGRTGGPLSSRYESRIRRAVKGLGAWLTTRGGDNVAGITRYEAGLYAEHLTATCNTGQTAASLVTALSSYWRWLVRRGAAQDNPWINQAPERRTSAGDADKRPYADAEIVALLSGDTYSTLHDMMRIAALSGMRINEIGRLRIVDCVDGAFSITTAKTAAGVRRVPIHPALAAIIARRRAGKDGDAFLFDELSARRDHMGDRAAKASERFTAYRRGLGIDERKVGQRQSNVDFHSFRRWFATKAEQAGQPPHVISAVLGHVEGRQGMTLGTYSGGPSQDQMRAVVESIHLPRGTPANKQSGARMGDGRWPQSGARLRSVESEG